MVIALGRTLGLTTVGEGVETADRLQELRRLGCDEVQGFGVASPMPAEQVEAFLAGEAGAAAGAAGPAAARSLSSGTRSVPMSPTAPGAGLPARSTPFLARRPDEGLPLEPPFGRDDRQAGRP